MPKVTEVGGLTRGGKLLKTDGDMAESLIELVQLEGICNLDSDPETHS